MISVPAYRTVRASRTPERALFVFVVVSPILPTINSLQTKDYPKPSHHGMSPVEIRIMDCDISRMALAAVPKKQYSVIQLSRHANKTMSKVYKIMHILHFRLKTSPKAELLRARYNGYDFP